MDGRIKLEIKIKIKIKKRIRGVAKKGAP